MWANTVGAGGKDTNPGRPHWSPLPPFPTFANVLCNGWPDFILKICTTGCMITSAQVSGETFLPLNSAFWASAASFPPPANGSSAFWRFLKYFFLRCFGLQNCCLGRWGLMRLACFNHINYGDPASCIFKVFSCLTTVEPPTLLGSLCYSWWCGHTSMAVCPPGLASSLPIQFSQ